jgi:hypothetical protein
MSENILHLNNSSKNTFSHLPLTPQAWKRQFERGENDALAYNYIADLRATTEPMDQWRRLKQPAQLEVPSLPDNVIGQLLEKARPFLDALPAAHSKGHVARDMVNLTAILHDPDVPSYGDVELLVGIFGGIFHDIGNAVVDRYDEGKRFAGHAEIGAILFGELAKDILPENLRNLTQLVIAAHVNVPKSIEVVKATGEKKTRKPYDNAIEGTDKRGMLIARLSDRLEIQSIIQLIRLSLANAKPIEDQGGDDTLYAVKATAEEQFRYKFSTNPQTKGSILYSLGQYAKGSPEHIKDDPPHIQLEILSPAAQEIFQAINTITSDAVTIMQLDERRRVFEQYLRLCNLVEPGSDIETVIADLRRNFTQLSEDEQNRWSKGFNEILQSEGGIYSHWHQRMSQRIAYVPTFSGKALTAKTQTIVSDLHRRANDVLNVFQLIHIDNPTEHQVSL